MENFLFRTEKFNNNRIKKNPFLKKRSVNSNNLNLESLEYESEKIKVDNSRRVKSVYKRSGVIIDSKSILANERTVLK